MGLRNYAKLGNVSQKAYKAIYPHFPWVWKTYNPMFCIFWMLVLDSDTCYACWSFLSPHSWRFCHCVSQSLNIVMYKILWLVSSRTATLTLSLLILSFSSVLLGRGLLIFLEWQHPLQALHLLRCLHLNSWWSLPTAKGMLAVWSAGTLLVPSLVNFPVSLFPSILWCLGIHLKLTLLISVWFSNESIHCGILARSFSLHLIWDLPSFS